MDDGGAQPGAQAAAADDAGRRAGNAGGRADGRPTRRAPSLTRRMFAALVAVAVFSATAVTLVSALIYQSTITQDAHRQLTRDCDVVRSVLDDQIAHGGLAVDVLDALHLDDMRVTLVSADGDVLFDSQVDDASDLPNHASRPEIESALATGAGSDERMSKTVGYVSIYHAERLSDGSVVRLSLDRAGITTVLAHATLMLVACSAVLVVICWVVSFVATRYLMKPILAIPLAGDVRPLPSEDDDDEGDAHDGTDIECVDAEAEDVETVDAPVGDAADADAPAPAGDERAVPAAVTYRELQPLVTRIEEQQAALMRQMEGLRNANLMRQQFTANVTHELKTPLTSISGAAELIRDGIARPEDVRNFAGRIYDEAHHLTGLVNDILTLSRLDESERAGDQNIVGAREPCDLLASARDVTERLAERAQKEQVLLEVIGKSEIVMGKAQLLDEITYNLCDNAIRYNHPGGWVHVFVGDDHDTPYLQVRDNGIGIPRASQDKVFQRFYRVDKSRSRESGGTGLGLAIVKHAATFHGAHIELRSEFGKGTSITVWFPPVEKGDLHFSS
ncbi:HAMP domain-containing histidine kinase [bacterium]|nr:HAMP domain-containing histidine kinase [bacterium]